MDNNVIYCGDNLDVMQKYITDESVDLIYIDPPFNSSRNYEVFWGEAQERRAFDDRFGDAMTYLDWMRPRLRDLYRALKPTGSFYYHCDWHASHYIKLELDRIFGFDNFRNEIIWQRAGAHNDSRRFGTVTESIFFYTKSSKYIWNRQYTPYDPEYIRERYKYVDNGDNRPYWRNTMTAAGPGGARVFKGQLREPPPGTHWRFSQEEINRMESEGRIYYSPSVMPYVKSYLQDMHGRSLQNLWTDIHMSKSGRERLGYPTQKPLALLERIIQASSNEGDTVLDAFCGCGTALEAAGRLKRQWIGIDFSPTACRVMTERLEKRLGLKQDVDFALRDMPKTPEQLHRMPPFEFENWAVVALGGIPNKVKVGDYGIDGRLYLADIEKGHRGDFMEVLDRWYPIQVKQRDHVGRPDIDKFETAMRRDKRLKGYFVAFGFSHDAEVEIKRANTHDGIDIVPITVGELLRHEQITGA